MTVRLHPVNEPPHLSEMTAFFFFLFFLLLMCQNTHALKNKRQPAAPEATAPTSAVITGQLVVEFAEFISPS